jgi:hypothetical protein
MLEHIAVADIFLECSDLSGVGYLASTYQFFSDVIVYMQNHLLSKIHLKNLRFVARVCQIHQIYKQNTDMKMEISK